MLGTFPILHSNVLQAKSGNHSQGRWGPRHERTSRDPRIPPFTRGFCAITTLVPVSCSSCCILKKNLWASATLAAVSSSISKTSGIDDTYKREISVEKATISTNRRARRLSICDHQFPYLARLTRFRDGTSLSFPSGCFGVSCWSVSRRYSCS